MTDARATSCCPPPRPRAAPRPAPARSAATGAASAAPRARVPGGRAVVGTDRPVIAGDGEGPCRRVALRGFEVDRHAVTRDRFAAFVAATGHVTDAERFGWSLVFQAFRPDLADVPRVVATPWWLRVEGASWRDPHGPGGAPVPGDHPAVHVSWTDAAAFATWSGGRLPTEAEWEHAARGGLGDVRYPWGDADPGEDGPHPCNVWQGRFPDRDTGADGYRGTAPVDAYDPNGYGLYQSVGNVWEWTADPYRVRSLKAAAKARNAVARAGDERVLKGGSYLCHPSYCWRYRIAARSGVTPDSSTGHAGFRVVYDAAGDAAAR